MQNVKAMCDTWNNSDFQGDARIREALNAHAQRRQHTLTFIEGFYQNVLTEIESLLSAAEKPRFTHYINDRRRRMADAGISSRNMNPDDCPRRRSNSFLLPEQPTRHRIIRYDLPMF